MDCTGVDDCALSSAGIFSDAAPAVEIRQKPKQKRTKTKKRTRGKRSTDPITELFSFVPCLYIWLPSGFPWSFKVFTGFSEICSDLHFIWPGFNGFSLVFFRDFLWSSLNLTLFYWVLPSLTGFDWVWLGLTGFDWVLLSFHWVWLSFT